MLAGAVRRIERIADQTGCAGDVDDAGAAVRGAELCAEAVKSLVVF